jgi:uncharacterized Tic20 family protein
MSAVPPPPVVLSQQERDERMWGLLVHVIPLFGFSIIFPIVIMLVKPHDSEFIYHHAKQSLIFQVSMLVLTILTVVLCFVLVGFLLLPVVLVLHFAGPIVAGVRANEGKWYRYPIIGGSATP